ncbi:hypothetical protein [Halovenus sp. HT40]|uniref:hypothetical protein n=1 Tax=Halovenus sp. HT40 TaxID=3126691 RepID=UPI00300F4F2D
MDNDAGAESPRSEPIPRAISNLGIPGEYQRTVANLLSTIDGVFAPNDVELGHRDDDPKPVEGTLGVAESPQQLPESVKDTLPRATRFGLQAVARTMTASDRRAVLRDGVGILAQQISDGDAAIDGYQPSTYHHHRTAERVVAAVSLAFCVHDIPVLSRELAAVCMTANLGNGSDIDEIAIDRVQQSRREMRTTPRLFCADQATRSWVLRGTIAMRLAAENGFIEPCRCEAVVDEAVERIDWLRDSYSDRVGSLANQSVACAAMEAVRRETELLGMSAKILGNMIGVSGVTIGERYSEFFDVESPDETEEQNVHS